jgi:hypothetical protein
MDTAIRPAIMLKMVIARHRNLLRFGGFEVDVINDLHPAWAFNQSSLTRLAYFRRARGQACLKVSKNLHT